MNNNTLSISDVGVTYGKVEYVDAGYFSERMTFFLDKYCSQYQSWSEFLIAHLSGRTDPNNFDFDEWAFLCEHLMYADSEDGPPNPCVKSSERPDFESGLSLFGGCRCSIQIPIL